MYLKCKIHTELYIFNMRNWIWNILKIILYWLHIKMMISWAYWVKQTVWLKFLFLCSCLIWPVEHMYYKSAESHRSRSVFLIIGCNRINWKVEKNISVKSDWISLGWDLSTHVFKNIPVILICSQKWHAISPADSRKMLKDFQRGTNQVLSDVVERWIWKS